jgi:hypothetical protein
MLQCPKCKSADIHRSRSRSWWEAWKKQMTSKRAYRCDTCGWRGWGDDTGTRFDQAERDIAEQAIAAKPPDLRTATLPEEPRPADLPDLEALDVSIRFPPKNQAH